MTYTVEEISRILGAEASGNLKILVDGLAEPATAGETDLAIALSPKYSSDLRLGFAQAALVWKEADWQSFGLKAAIQVEESRYALARVSALFPTPPLSADGIHPMASIAPGAEIGEAVAIGPQTVIGNGARIGRNAMIGPNCTIGPGVVIGESALIYPGTRIGHGVVIGDRLIAHGNCVIGSDGFSFATEKPGAVEQVRATLPGRITVSNGRQTRIHSHGTVRIGDDVEIGACTAIDRGTVAATVIGDGTKIDNQVHIAHNVQIGRHCLICGQVGIAGSAIIGDRVVLAGMSGVSDHVHIGDDVVAAGASKIYTRVRSGTAVMGSPAIEMDRNIELYRHLRRLPRLADRLRAVENHVSKLGKTD
ncbi:MAG: UDP-3-O-(3-hydroxymyristoyl)glucosamine N-acyltransferase [Rhodobacteraceae bacterium]|nr:UDP-3-O-(3-hydroxymyristoyl)glucosamine N-acyltransferase [Paracoccaceae bacterium]